MWRYLAHQDKNHKSAFQTSISPLEDFTPKSWYYFCASLEYTAEINRLWMHPYYCHKKESGGSSHGFIVADPLLNPDADLPVKYQYLIPDWGQQLYKAFSKPGIIPEGQGQRILRAYADDGFSFIRSMHIILHPKLMEIPSSVCNAIPKQSGSTFEEYVSSVKFYHAMLGFLQDIKQDIGERYIQDIFLSNMDHSTEIINYVRTQRDSGVSTEKVKYTKGNFIQTISMIIETLKLVSRSGGRTTSTTRSPSYSTARTNAINILHSLQENGMSHDPFYTKEGLYSIAFSGIDLNDPSIDDNKLTLLCNAIDQHGADKNRIFDTSRPCAVCAGTGHTFDDCPELKDPGQVRTAYIKLRVALDRLKNVASKLHHSNLNSMDVYTINAVRMMDENMPQTHPINRLSSNHSNSSKSSLGASSSSSSGMERLLKHQAHALRQTNIKINSLAELLESNQVNTNGDDASTTGSSLDTTTMDFLMGRSK